MRLSVTRSATESKNAPRTDAGPLALARAPSSRSGTADGDEQDQTQPEIRPLAITTAAGTAMTSPKAVRWSGVSRVRPKRRADRADALVDAVAEPSIEQRWSSALWCSRKLPITVPPVVDYAGVCLRFHPLRAENEVPADEDVSIRRRSATSHSSGTGARARPRLAEALLFCAGAISRKGRVEDGTTTCDFDPEEVKRQISVSVALAPFEWQDHKVNLLDCPGYADFSGDAVAALRVADLAVFVVSAVEGVEVQTEMMWKVAAELGLPRLVFINKLDRERASFERTLDQLQRTFGAGIAPLELPDRRGGGLPGRRRPALRHRPSPTRAASPVTGAIPDDMEAQEHSVHERPGRGHRRRRRRPHGALPRRRHAERGGAREDAGPGVASASVFPVVCGSAVKDIAVDRLATFICEIGPSPEQRPPVVVRAGDRDTEVSLDAGGQPLAVVFKTIADPYVGKISMFKVLSGTMRPDAVLTNPRTHADEKLHALFTLRGKEQVRSTRCRPATSWRWPSWATPPPATPWRPRGRRSSCPIEPEAARSCRSPSGRSPRATRTSS